MINGTAKDALPAEPGDTGRMEYPAKRQLTTTNVDSTIKKRS